MIYKEIKKDLFDMPSDYYLAHCISADFKMGAGIAVQFNKRFNMKNILKETYLDYFEYWQAYEIIGDCLLENKVFNLITKTHYWDKPTYKSLAQALQQMKYMCEINNIKKVAMPIIGCGLDKLNWDKVSNIIQDTFKDIDIEIIICKQ